MTRKFDKTKKRDKLDIRIRSTDRTTLHTWTIKGTTHIYSRRLSSWVRRDKSQILKGGGVSLPYREKYFWEWFAENHKEKLEVLTERQKEIFLLRYEKKLSVVEIARILKVSKQGIHKQLRVIYEKLRGIFYHGV